MDEFLNNGHRARACGWMALAMALHFGGYEFVRASNMSLFTSPQTGFTSPAAFPLALAAVSPFSMALLWAYSKELDESGPQSALRQTTLWSIGAIALSALLFAALEKNPHTLNFGKLLVGLAFVFQNSYAHLLYTQQWSFITSIMTPAEGALWFPGISGLSSLFTAISGSSVGLLVHKLGLAGLTACTVGTLVLTLICGERAYRTAYTHGFDPAAEMQRIKAEKAKKQKKLQKTTKKEPSSKPKKGEAAAELAPQKQEEETIITKARALFQRVPTLGALFFEVLSFQALSTILNVCMVTKLKEAIVDDMDRASWTGKFYAIINGVSGTFQFVLLPLLMKHIEPRLAWRLMPFLPLLCTIYTSFFQGSDPSLMILAFAFFAAKTMDYSVRGVANELVYTPLDFESRYLGKEIIGVLANRFGKSGMSLFLSMLSYGLGPAGFGVRQLTQLSTLVSGAWLGCCWYLSELVPKREQASATVEKRQQEMKKHQRQKKGT